jgi:hypothetical protein
MNERYRELAQLAVADAAKYCQCPFDLTREENETFAMSFAEMIVRECAEVAGCNGHVSGFSLGDLIKQHFGVES